jgi:hypothetical protein
MSSQNEVFNRFVEMISAIIKRPAMYGVSNVEGIYLFILGYGFGSGSSKETMFLISTVNLGIL